MAREEHNNSKYQQQYLRWIYGVSSTHPPPSTKKELTRMKQQNYNRTQSFFENVTRVFISNVEGNYRLVVRSRVAGVPTLS